MELFGEESHSIMISCDHASTLLVEAWELSALEGVTQCYTLSHPVYFNATLSALRQL